MTQAIAIRTSLLTSFTLLLCHSIVCAEDGVTIISGNLTVPVNRSESIATLTIEPPAEKKVTDSNPAEEQPSSAIPQVRPGERVSNPNHLILNSDTTLGGVEVEGSSPTDYGYRGPGDMRTHLWNGHSNELIENGITEHKLMAMTKPEVQQWHNYFHGVEGSPDDHLDDDEQSRAITFVEQTTMPLSPNYVGEPVDETIDYEMIVDGHYEYDNSAYSQSGYGQSEFIYEQGIIIEGATSYEFETQIQPTILSQDVFQFEPSDR